MAKANEVSFKAFLLKDGEKPEIRRFSLSEDVATSFIYLKEKLRAVFPAKLSQGFDVYWKDAEGDEVTISSDDELTIALTDCRDEEILRVFIKAHKSVAGGNTQGPTHEGVFCDECDKPITGSRYKCLGCTDFDLCGDCEFKGKHKDHFAVRIPIPLNVRHQFGHRLIHKISKAAKRAESRCPWSHRSGIPHGGQPGTYSFYENLAEQFTNNCNTEEMPNRTCEGTSRNHSRRQSRCGATSTATAGQANTQNSSAQSECRSEHTGETGATEVPPIPITFDPAVIFNTLASFGIDLSGLSGFFPPPPASQTPTQTSTQTPQENLQTQQEKSFQNVSNEEEQNGQTASKVPKMSQQTNEKSAPSSISAGSKRASLTDEWTVYNPNEAQSIEIDLDINMTPPPQSSAPIEKGTTNTEMRPEPSTSTAANLYPSLAGLPKDKKVTDALDKMLSMGFKNEDGWLTNLLNLQDGNIEKVLDLIQPARK